MEKGLVLWLQVKILGFVYFGGSISYLSIRINEMLSTNGDEIDKEKQNNCCGVASVSIQENEDQN